MSYHDYIIVGAGPAGLQMGYFLEKAKRDYLILEANDTAGSFFATQPRHRTLLSLNKRHNVYEEAEFNMRHDWNSLLTDDYSLLFRDYSDDLYPDADDLCRYLGDFAEKYMLNIQYNTRITSIDKSRSGHSNFILTDTEGKEYTCSCLLMATGATGPSIPQEIEGIELAEEYNTHEINPKFYDNKRVLIIGRGNSAFEVANHLAGHAGIIHIGIGNRPVDLAWQTHAVGHVRSINNTILEMLHVKALHAAFAFTIKRLSKQADGTIRVDIIEEYPHWKVPGRLLVEEFYDHVICCTGWKYTNPSLFTPETRPEVDQKGKYPTLNSSWESSVPNLFFIGAPMASRDRKSASAFIHGFRYNIRTLHHLLEQRYEGVPLPRQQFELQTQKDLEALAEAILQRMSVSDALYQLFEFLGDVLVFSPGKVEYFRDLPIAYIFEHPEFNDGREILTITLEYGFHHFEEASALNFISANDEGDRSTSAFIHPIFRHYVNGEMIKETHLDESFDVRYNMPSTPRESEQPKGFRNFGWRLFDIRRNIVMNAINNVVKITSEIFPEEMYFAYRFLPWPEERDVQEYIRDYKRPQLKQKV